MLPLPLVLVLVLVLVIPLLLLMLLLLIAPKRPGTGELCELQRRGGGLASDAVGALELQSDDQVWIL